MKKFTSSLILMHFALAFTFAQPNLDSIYAVWQDAEENDTVRVQSLLRFARYGYLFSDPDSANYFAQQASDFAKEKGIKNWYSESLKIQGISFAIQGYHSVAIKYFNGALQINEALNDSVALAGSINNIGLLHQETGDLEHALEYLLKSYDMYLALDDINGKALCSGNIGMIYDKLGQPEKALDYLIKSLEFYTEMGQKKGIGNTYSSLGSVYGSLGDLSAEQDDKDQANDHYKKALEYFEKSLAFRREVNDQEGIAITLNGMGRIYKNQKNYLKALPYLQQSLQKAQDIGSYPAIESAAWDLYEVYQNNGEYKKALEMHLAYTSAKDSIMNEENQRAVIKQEYEHNYEQKAFADSLKVVAEKQEMELLHEQEVLEEKHNRNLALFGGLGILILAAGLYSRLRYTKKSKQALQKEKDRSDELLLNILPAEVAEELKSTGTSEARDFDNVTVLFTDFEGFTNTAEKLTAKELVSELNYCFKAFDGIMAKHKLEKIKTIGDAYMAAGGLEVPKTSEPKNVVSAALEMQAFMKIRKEEQTAKNKSCFEMRSGIHTGPVVAGIVGIKKFQYDIWGDTVNTASRMESAGEVGKVNISQATYELLMKDVDTSAPLSVQNQFEFESRGKVEVKGKGEMEMLFVSLSNRNKEE